MHGKAVTSSVRLCEVTGRAVYDQSPIDNDSYVVAELFSFIHTVCSQQHGGICQAFDQPEEVASGDWVNTSSRLIEHLHLWAEDQTQRTAKLTLISTTQIARFDLSKAF